MGMLDASDKKLIANVKKYGFHSQHVFEDADGPAFQYSIGFSDTLKSPEIIVFGLERKLMHSMLWEMFRQIKAGSFLNEGARWSGLLGGHDCISRRVHPSQLREYFGIGLWYERHRRRDPGLLLAYQLFWPGTQQGLFPWDAGCAEEVREYQPALYLPREVGLA